MLVNRLKRRIKSMSFLLILSRLDWLELTVGASGDGFHYREEIPWIVQTYDATGLWQSICNTELCFTVSGAHSKSPSTTLVFPECTWQVKLFLVFSLKHGGQYQKQQREPCISEQGTKWKWKMTQPKAEQRQLTIEYTKCRLKRLAT